MEKSKGSFFVAAIVTDLLISGFDILCSGIVLLLWIGVLQTAGVIGFYLN